MEKKIVIIGGGFAGVNLARHLVNREGFFITLVDKNNYNFFPPLLYQVAAGLLEYTNISTPFRTLFKGKRNFRFRLGELQRIDPAQKTVHLSTGQLKYDELVLATGTKSNYFGMENIEKNALPMKTIDDALEIQNHLLQKTEEATFITDPAELEKIRKVVISGAGPTGVEVAGMIAEMRNHLIRKIYPELQSYNIEIFLVDAAPTVLPPMSSKSQKYTYNALRKLGVHVLLNKMVKDYDDDTVVFSDRDTLQTKTLIWTAGVTSRVFEGIPEECYEKGNRLKVDAFNKIEGTDHMYAIGDTCLQTTDKNYPEGHPQLANVALQQGENLAKNFIAMKTGRKLVPFSYFNKGSMAIIGRIRAVADLNYPKYTITGWFAWVMWLFVHLFELISYRNRIKTMWNWTIAYFKLDLSHGLIVRPSKKVPTDSETAI